MARGRPTLGIFDEKSPGGFDPIGTILDFDPNAIQRSFISREVDFVLGPLPDRSPADLFARLNEIFEAAREMTWRTRLIDGTAVDFDGFIFRPGIDQAGNVARPRFKMTGLARPSEGT